jgi:chemotaxis signal transduction protein
MDEQPAGTMVLSGSSGAYTLEQLSDADFWSYARAQANSAAPSLAQYEEYLECRGAYRCLLPLSVLFEVVPPPHRFALLPAMPGWMPGVLAWRGETIAVVDLVAYLARSTVRSSNVFEPIVLIAHHADLTIGLLVPAIGSTTSIADETLRRSQLEHVPEEEGWDETKGRDKSGPEGRNKLGPYTLSAQVEPEIIKGMYENALVLDVPILLANIVQQIGTYHGRSNLSLSAG